MTAILVVGANGQVGRSLCALDGQAGFEIVGLTRAELDITDAAAVERAVGARPFAAVINAAAYTAVDKAESDSAAAYAINRDGPRNLAIAAAGRKIPLLHISTDYVFDGSQEAAYRESDPVRPTGVYGASKLAGEAAVREAHPHHIILRTAWVYGPWTGNFVATMLRLATERSELRVVADQRGGPTEAGAIAHALLSIVGKLGQEDGWGTYHFSGAPAVTWHGFAEEIVARAAGRLARVPSVLQISTVDYPTPARRPANSVLDCSKIGRRFGIGQPDWRDSLDEIVATIQTAALQQRDQLRKHAR